MNDKQKTKAFNAERKKQQQQDVAIQKNTYGDIIRLLKIAEKDINTSLSNAPTDYETWYLPQLQNSVKSSLEEFSAMAAKQSQSGADKSFAAGQQLIDAPLNAAQPGIVSQLGQIDNKQLLAMKSFMTDRIKDIGTQLTNKINTQLGLTVIGAQTPYDARQTIAKLFDTQGEKRALAIVRTELGRVYSTAAQQRAEQAHDILPGLKKQWRRSGKLHSRVNHDAADGQIQEVKEPFKIGRTKMMYPKDPKAPVKEVIHCGCQSIPYMEHWDMKNPGRKPFTQTEIDGDYNKRLLSGIGAPENKVIPASTPYWMASTAQTKWHNNSFAKAPIMLKEAVKKFDNRLNDVTYDAPGARFYPGRSVIDMDSLKRSNRKDQASWQHEYGHFLDNEYGRAFTGAGARSDQDDFMQALSNDKKHLLETSGMGRKSKRQGDILANNAILNKRVNDTLAPLDKKRRQQWVDEAGESLGLKRKDVLAIMKSDGHYDEFESLRDIRAAQLLEAINRRDMRSFLTYFNGLDVPYKERKSVYSKGLAANVSDLIGSMTKNKLGGMGLHGIAGHRNSYYKKNRYAQGHETFANLTALVAQDKRFWTVLMDAFTPELHNLYKEILRNE